MSLQTWFSMSQEIFQRISLIDRIVNDIKGRIISKQLKEGDLLPSQEEMASNLGVSRASLREALNRLTLMGLVEVKHGVGTFIRRAARPEFLINSISSLIIMDHLSAEELLQARQLIEPAVTALAAECATQGEIENIRTVLQAMEGEFRIGLIENYKEKDTQFHMLIAASSHNRVLTKVVQAIRELLPGVIFKAFAESHSLQASAMGYHRRIFESLRRRDPERARQEMEAHLMSLKSLQKQFFDWESQNPTDFHKTT
jgi:GntR family transcriptional repressor for pyruvate dehydrogenase complex